jgi:hypothetical protein
MFMNEPNYAAMGGAPKGYDAERMRKTFEYSAGSSRTLHRTHSSSDQGRPAKVACWQLRRRQDA